MEWYCPNSATSDAEGSGQTGNDHSNMDNTLIVDKHPSSVIHRSSLFWSLAVAAADPLSLPKIMMHVFDEIQRLTAADWDSPLSDLPSESTAVEHGSSDCFKLLNHDVRDLILCITSLMQKK